MGNGNLKGGIHVQLEKGIYKGGEQVTGTVFLQLQEPSPSGAIVLGFQGTEYTRWKERRTRGTGKNRRTYYVTRSAKAVLCNYRFTLYQFPGEVPSQGITIPFSFVLPQNLPGSFNLSYFNTHAEISYSVGAEFTNIEQKGISNFSRLKLYQEIQSLGQAESVSKSAKLLTWCCLNKGTCSIRADYPQSSYTPAETAAVNVTLDNSESKIAVNSISMKLFKTIRLLAHPGSKVVSYCIVEASGQGTEAGTENPKSLTTQLFLNLSSVANQFEDQYTTYGNLISCEYTLEVSGDMDGCCMCCGDVPIVQKRVIILPQYMPPPPLPPPPPGWNPQYMNQVAFMYPPEYQPQVQNFEDQEDDNPNF